MQKHEKLKRYQRQIILPEFGESAQYKLLAASVLVIGAGGLGCPVLQYLAAAGVGCIGIVDDDNVQLHNLQRQVLYTMDDIDMPKAEVAGQKLRTLNPDIEVKVFQDRLTTYNCLEYMASFDLIVDCTDNFATRYMINDACVLLGKPLVFGAISRFEGQVAVFNVPSGIEGERIHYRDLFPHPPQAGEVLSCAEAGVLGVLPAIIGSMMANEAIKLLAGLGKPLIGTMLTYNALTNDTMKWLLQKHTESDRLFPASASVFNSKDYAWECGVPSTDLEIDVAKMEDLMKGGNVVLVDVRELHETPLITKWDHEKLPLKKLMQGGMDWHAEKVVFICQSGKRSLTAAHWAKEQYAGKKFYSLKGGVEGLKI